MGEHGAEQPAHEPVPDHERASARQTLGSPQHARERLDVGADGVVEAVGQLDPVVSPDALGEAAGDDRRPGEALARRLVPSEAACALAAAHVVDERHAHAVGGLRGDLVAEHRAGRCDIQLLDVRAAEAAREHADELAHAVRLRHLGRPRRCLVPHGDGAHVGNRR